MRGLKGEVVIVAGGGSGIGEATATRLAEEGARVVVGDINVPAAESVAAQITEAGGQAISLGVDVANEIEVNAIVAETVKRFGGLDHFHFNAAALHLTGNDTDPLDIEMSLYDETMNVNLRGAMLCTRAALPRMLEGGGGAMVYTGSGAAYVGDPVRVSYAISKTGLSALARNIASRYGQQGIRANVVSPGPVVTDAYMANATEERLAQTRKRIRSKRLGKPEDIAAAVTFLMSEDGEWINGQLISVNGGAILRA